jgi:hypothetical protein
MLNMSADQIGWLGAAGTVPLLGLLTVAVWWHWR